MDLIKDTEFETRKKIFEEVKRFNRTELEELYKILRKGGEEVSENRNGMFFDLLSVKQETIEKIQGLITFCIENRINFDQRERAMDALGSATGRAEA
jgi:anthranilate phosphoribosyltransferase